jgi:CRP/FNR family transcriptional regulator, cyclic AMP receptor protein
MLTHTDIPDWLGRLHDESRRISRLIFERVFDKGDCGRLPREQDLLSRPQSIYIQDGLFQLIQDDRLIRLYGPGDWTPLCWQGKTEHCVLKSDFGSDVVSFELTFFEELIDGDSELRAWWRKRSGLEERILIGLAGLYATEDAAPEVHFQQFQSGDKIIQQGDKAEEVFEMVQGQATVVVDGVEVGHIKAGEFFGEIAFLAEEARNATVVANTSCYVNRLTHDELTRLIQTRPQMTLALAKTLAKRVSKLNRELLAKG